VLSALLPRSAEATRAAFRRRAAPLTFAGALAVVFGGCIDPHADYDAFVARAPAPDAAPPATDAQAADPCPEILSGPPMGTFYGACLTTANSGDVTQATYAKLDAMLVPSADHTTGQLTVVFTSLVRNPKNVSQTAGAPGAPKTAAVSAQCTYVLDEGTQLIPAAANAAATDITLSNARYRGKLLTPDETCSALDAMITIPATVDLTKGGNYCIFRRSPSDGSITPFTIDEFACPGAPPAM
jgi:hypothetical protein